MENESESDSTQSLDEDDTIHNLLIRKRNLKKKLNQTHKAIKKSKRDNISELLRESIKQRLHTRR